MRNHRAAISVTNAGQKGCKAVPTQTNRKFRRWLVLCTLLVAVLSAQVNSAVMAVLGDTMIVDLSQALGEPTYRASGFIYGLSQDGAQPPINLQTDIKTQFIRAGGAQLGCPNGGWVNGAYDARWASVKGYYERAKAIGATFILLPHDLWGADGVCNVPEWPGDDGDWTRYTEFMNQVIGDVIANGMTGTDVQWDIWNEPDIALFWHRDQDQYLETWKRAYEMIRAAIPDAVIVGPSTARQPAQFDVWYPRYLDYIMENNVVPDILSWHQLVPTSDPQNSKRYLDELLSVRGLSVQGFQVNEYGDCCTYEQEPGASVWYIGRFERDGIDAARANWRMGAELHGGMGGLVTVGGEPMGVWWAYKRYADMTGQMVSVTAGKSLDGVAATDAEARRAIILVGSRAIRGEVAVEVRGLDAASYLMNDRLVNVMIERIPSGQDGVTELPIVLSQAITVTDETLTLTWNWDTPFGAYAITLTPAG